MVSSRHAQVCFHWIFKFQSLTFAFVQPLTNFYSRDFIAGRNLFVVCFRSEKNYFFLGTGNISVWHPFYISKRTHKFQCRAERVFHVILFEPQVKNHGLKIIIFSSHLEFPPIAWFAKSGCLNRLQSVSVASLLLGADWEWFITIFVNRLQSKYFSTCEFISSLIIQSLLRGWARLVESINFARKSQSNSMKVEPFYIHLFYAQSWLKLWVVFETKINLCSKIKIQIHSNDGEVKM